jgi:pimeloyl-ACP methyl ester carboxylesterase
MHSSVIREASYIEIGGIPQWVQIRGDAAENPVLLFLHGGPGASAIKFGAGWREWEKDFTIVHWDQRGAGRTFKKNGTRLGELMTIQQMADDGLQLVEFLRDRLRARRIILVGHSWGSVIGIRMIRAKPDLFSAFVGVAQITNTRRNGALRYQKLIAALQTQGNAKAVRRLEQIGPPPYGPEHSKWAAFNCLSALERHAYNRRKPDLRSFLGLRRYCLTLASRTALALIAIMPAAITGCSLALTSLVLGIVSALAATWSADRRGWMFSWQQIIISNGEFEHVDLPSTDLKFEVPIFFFSGTHDQLTPVEFAEEYLSLLEAPHKELVRFERRGHYFLFNAPGTFFAELLRRVRPCALNP